MPEYKEKSRKHSTWEKDGLLLKWEHGSELLDISTSKGVVSLDDEDIDELIAVLNSLRSDLCI